MGCNSRTGMFTEIAQLANHHSLQVSVQGMTSITSYITSCYYAITEIEQMNMAESKLQLSNASTVVINMLG